MGNIIRKYVIKVLVIAGFVIGVLIGGSIALINTEYEFGALVAGMIIGFLTSEIIDEIFHMEET